MSGVFYLGNVLELIVHRFNDSSLSEKKFVGNAPINSNKKKFLKTIRYELLSTPAYLGENKRQAYPIFGQITKNTTIILVHMEKIKGFLFAVRHREILMTDLGLTQMLDVFSTNMFVCCKYPNNGDVLLSV